MQCLCLCGHVRVHVCVHVYVYSDLMYCIALVYPSFDFCIPFDSIVNCLALNQGLGLVPNLKRDLFVLDFVL